MNIQVGWWFFFLFQLQLLLYTNYIMCKPLGSKAFYFICVCAWKCVLCIFFCFFFFIFIAFVPPKKPFAWSACAFNVMCAPLYKLNVIEIVILPIEFGRRPILLGQMIVLIFFSLCANEQAAKQQQNKTYANSFWPLPFKCHKNNEFYSLILT